MSETTHLGLPYLAAAQAQKHVTVNEALARLDALTHLAVLSRALSVPPAEPEEGARYIVSTPASGAWEGEEEKIAAFLGGAWSFIAPRAGFRAYVADEALELLYDGGWTVAGGGAPMGLLGESASGAGFTASVAEVEHTITAGASNDTALLIPDRAVVIGVTGKVSDAITGASSWSLGVAADPQRYGNGIGVMADSTVVGVSGTPVAYYGATPIRVTAGGPDFTGGKIKLALHYFEVGLPG